MRRGRRPDYLTRGNPSKMALEGNARFLRGVYGKTTAEDGAKDERAATGLVRAPRWCPTEQQEAEGLALCVLVRWWVWGLTRHRSEAGSVLDGRQGMAEGGVADWPDYTLVIPGVGSLAVELKALDARPLTSRGGRDTLGGCSRGQARKLRELTAAGWRTCVAYGADEALASMDRFAGPRPDRLPEGWR